MAKERLDLGIDETAPIIEQDYYKFLEKNSRGHKLTDKINYLQSIGKPLTEYQLTPRSIEVLRTIENVYYRDQAELEKGETND